MRQKGDPVLLTQCEWVLDGITGRKFVRIEGKIYEYTLRPGAVDLVKPDGETYTVTALACSCKDHRYNRRPSGCKHRAACKRLGLLARAAALKQQEQPQEESTNA